MQCTRALPQPWNPLYRIYLHLRPIIQGGKILASTPRTRQRSGSSSREAARSSAYGR